MHDGKIALIYTPGHQRTTKVVRLETQVVSDMKISGLIQ